MIKVYSLLTVLAVSLFFAACSEDPYRIENSTCGKFLKNNPDIAKRYQYISCFDSMHVIYQLRRMENEAFLAEVLENRIGKRLLIRYQAFDGNIIFTDLDTLKMRAFKDASKPIDRSNSFDTSYTYQKTKPVLMEIEGLDDIEFEQKFKSNDTLYAVMNNYVEWSGIFFKRFSMARKNDSTFYVIEVNMGKNNRVMLFSKDGKKLKNLFSYRLVTNCFENSPVYNMRPIGTDSTFSVKFSYAREEEKGKEYNGFVSFDLKNDSLSYGSEDSLTVFHITHYRANGDSVFIVPQFKEADLEKNKRRKCMGHFF